MKYSKLLILIFLGGCVKQGKIAYAQDEESTFGSPCIDGVVVNMSAGGCVEFDIVNHPNEGYLSAQCTKADNSTWWTAVKFRAYSTSLDTIAIPETWNMFCVDQKAAVFAMPK